MPRYLVIDTETSGLFNFALPADAPEQPRLASFTALEFDTDTTPPDETPEMFSTLVRPDGWEIAPEVTAINGLTTQTCMDTGVSIGSVLAYYTEKVLTGWIVVAYNAQFDTKVIRGEYRRANLPDLFEQTPNICLMRAAHKLKIEKAGEKKKGFPKLSDVIRHFFREDIEGPHHSEIDALAALRILRKMIPMNALPAPEVHYAKNRPMP
ncbi:MAG TPA: 3'-5' exonuclease, partial [Rhodocyclaceae bacterium]|nr:3'-5' exonuclease [Rhodocyclaceae bacterium]